MPYHVVTVVLVAAEVGLDLLHVGNPVDLGVYSCSEECRLQGTKRRITRPMTNSREKTIFEMFCGMKDSILFMI